MGKAAAAGVQVVVAPQLFPTLPGLADRMVTLADIRPGQQVLEPSAGTGRIIDAIRRNARGYAITAVELNCNMAHRLRTVDCVDDTRQADFLECNGDLGTFDRIVMNPPFANADDIKHIMHAVKMLKPGGRLVAICANGPRQNDKLRPIVEARGGIWEELCLQILSSAQVQAFAPSSLCWTHNRVRPRQGGTAAMRTLKRAQMAALISKTRTAVRVL